MLRWAVLFSALAIIVGVFGLANIATASAGIARTTFFSLLGIGAAFLALEYITPRR